MAPAKAKTTKKAPAKKTAAKKAPAKKTKAVVLTPDYDPTKDKGEYMNPVMLEFFRERLIEWRQELLHESSETIAKSSKPTHFKKATK